MTPATDFSRANSALAESVSAFLPCETPYEWVIEALNHQKELLIDHANCEKKAAATAMKLMYRYTDNSTLLTKMSQLAREELLHFQQVVELMRGRGIRYTQIAPSRYAAGLYQHVSKSGALALVDTLLIGAYIEARSCERFAFLAQVLDSELGKFYRNLLRSEARHFQDYLMLAFDAGHAEVDERIEYFGQIEKNLILTPDELFRFHSGMPIVAKSG